MATTKLKLNLSKEVTDVIRQLYAFPRPSKTDARELLLGLYMLGLNQRSLKDAYIPREKITGYCPICGTCGHIGCCGVRHFLERHVKGHTTCTQEEQMIEEIIWAVERGEDELLHQHTAALSQSPIADLEYAIHEPMILTSSSSKS